jgi:hypothetical protein
MRIIVEQRGHGWYHATPDIPYCSHYGRGTTIDSAVGDLITTYQHSLGIEVVVVEAQVAPVAEACTAVESYAEDWRVPDAH